MAHSSAPRSETVTLDRAPAIALWVGRAVWVAAPLAAGPMIAALDDAGLRWPVELIGWALWAAGLACLFLPRPAGLAVLRVIVPGLGWSLAALALSGQTISPLVIGAWALLACATLNRPVADALVDGKSYGSERRFALRLPPSIAILGLPLVALSWTGVVVGGFVMLRHGVVPGALLLSASALLAFSTLKSVGTISNRFLVFVPAGCVVADPFILFDPVLMPGSYLVSLGSHDDPVAPLPEDACSLDLRLGATLGSLRVRFTEPGRVAAKARFGGPKDVTEILVTPARTVAFMKTARARRILNARA